MRCKYCGKLLAKGSGYVQIKCARCKNINSFNN
ncbi:zinc finger domain-containing protein [Neisseria cinerea]|nr:Com family DNA-binding transcriptional regulator [Neisseria cinerea]